MTDLKSIRAMIANHQDLIDGLEEEVIRYENSNDKTSVRSMQEEIRRHKQDISNLESEL